MPFFVSLGSRSLKPERLLSLSLWQLLDQTVHLLPGSVRSVPVLGRHLLLPLWPILWSCPPAVSFLFAEVVMVAVMRAHLVPDLIAWVAVAVDDC